MGKCNICGSNRDIVYKSLIDGNVCLDCEKNMFEHIDNDIKAIKYNKPEVMRFITNIKDINTYRNIINLFRDIQYRYTYYIIGNEIDKDRLLMTCKTMYRNKVVNISIEISDTKCEYSILNLNDALQIKREFNGGIR